MANIYSDEEKQMHLNQYKVSGKTKTEYGKRSTKGRIETSGYIL